MSAAARDATLAWIGVAWSALERAAECAALGGIEAELEYQRLRAQVDEAVRDAYHAWQVANVIHQGFVRERGLPDEAA